MQPAGKSIIGTKPAKVLIASRDFFFKTDSQVQKLDEVQVLIPVEVRISSYRD
jgi:hypothetical protein